MKNSAPPKAIIIGKKEQAHLSSGQKTFNRLIKKINQQRKLLAQWQSNLPLYKAEYSSQFEPKMKKYNTYRHDLVILLEHAYEKGSFAKKDRQKLSDIIQSMAKELIVYDPKSHEALKDIYNKHSTQDYDQGMADEISDFKAMMKASLGIEIDDDIDFNSPEDVMLHMSKKMQDKFEQEDRLDQEPAKNKRKTAKQLAKEAKAEEEVQQMSQSIRDVFRKLAQALHPDRIADSEEKARRHELMQRVNVAYNQGDLLSLLELQLEVEQVDQQTINSLPEDRLKHYNKILNEQLDNLAFEINMHKNAIFLTYPISQQDIAVDK